LPAPQRLPVGQRGRRRAGGRRRRRARGRRRRGRRGRASRSRTARRVAPVVATTGGTHHGQAQQPGPQLHPACRSHPQPPFAPACFRGRRQTNPRTWCDCCHTTPGKERPTA
jgi:hypothetical protein